MSKRSSNLIESPFLRRALWVTALVAVTVFMLAGAVTIFVIAHDLFFLVMIAVLLAVFLNRCANWVTQKTRLPRGWSLTLVIASLIMVSSGGSALFGLQLHATAGDSVREFQVAVGHLRERVATVPWLHQALADTPFARQIVGPVIDAEPEIEDEGESPPSPAPEAATSDISIVALFQTSFGVIVDTVVVIALGIYIAADPDPYWKGIVLLFPRGRRPRVQQILRKLEKSLWRWLVGRLLAMVIVGISTGVLLFLLDVPMAATVGAVTMALMFIPNLGAVIALGIAAVLAFSKGWMTVSMVVGLYTIMILFEGFVVTPLIQRRQVSIPPALLIGVQTLAGVVFGFLGLTVASPVTAAIMVIIKEAYLKDTLGDTDEAVESAHDLKTADPSDAEVAWQEPSGEKTAEATG